MSKHIQKNTIALQFLKISSSKVVQAVINTSSASRIYAFSEIAYNAWQTKKTKLLKSLAFKGISIAKKRKLLKPIVVKNLIQYFDKHYGT